MTNVALFWNAFLSLVLVFQSQLELKHDASELTSPWPLTLTFKFFSPYFMAVVSISSVSFQAWLCVERPFCLPVQRCVLLEAVQQVSTRHSTSLRCVIMTLFLFYGAIMRSKVHVKCDWRLGGSFLLTRAPRVTLFSAGTLKQSGFSREFPHP